MSTTAHVVEGEASESESELEVPKPPNKSTSPFENVKAFVVAGEAPESDEECKLPEHPISMQEDIVIRDDTRSRTPPTPLRVHHPSLLHQKLWECNVSLHATMECMLKHTAELAVDKLTRADKTLLNVQECMRSTNANLTLAKAKLKQIQAGLDKAGCDTALQNVKPGY